MSALAARLYGAYLNLYAVGNRRAAARVAFNRFCRPRRPPLRPYHTAWLNKARAFTLNTPHSQVQVYRWGTGSRAILLLHGWESHAYFWRRTLDFLPPTYTAYALDAPCHGLSSGRYANLHVYSQVVEQLLAQTGPLEAFVGHSLGGFTALYTAYRLPHLAPVRLAALAVPGEVEAYFAWYRKLLGMTPRLAQALDRHTEATIGHPPPYFSALRFADSLPLDGLVVYDTADREAPVAYGEQLAARWPRAHYLVTEGLGHRLKSDRLAERVMAFATTGPHRTTPSPAPLP